MLGIFDELVALAYVFRDPSMTVQEPGGLRRYVTMCRTAFPNTHFTIEDQIAEGETVATHLTACGIDRGDSQAQMRIGWTNDILSSVAHCGSN